MSLRVRKRNQGSARVSRVGFGVAPKQSFLRFPTPKVVRAREKFVIARTRSPARGTRALPRALKKRVLEGRLEGAGFRFADSKLGSDFELGGAMDFHVDLSGPRERRAHRLHSQVRRVAIPAEMSEHDSLDFPG